MTLRTCALLAACWGVCLGVSGAEETTTLAAIEPPDVLVQVGQVRDELEQIRHVMGRPVNEQPDIEVSNAAPREVYFQALTMFRKAERLCFEQRREHAEEPGLPKGVIRPQDVMNVVDATLACLDRVQANLGIEKRSKPSSREPGKTPTDVFRSIVQANRQLNLLLDRGFAPSDVFEQVTLGIGYASRLLESFPGVVTIAEAPEFEVGKRPSDVYRRLLGCFEGVRGVANTSRLDVLQLKATEPQIAQAEPSDVYDIASLLVSELAYLHSQLDDAEPPRQVYYVGRKFPSHVFQRAGILERQLDELERLVNAHPDWLRGRKESP